MLWRYDLVNDTKKSITLSVVIPCFNEERTLKICVGRVLAIADESLSLDVLIVDDCSTDQSLIIAKELSSKHPEIRVFHHGKNEGKGAALRTGFEQAKGDFVAVQDADLEYDPLDLKRLLIPLRNNEADVVLGSRFLSYGAHRVLYYWHYLGNKFLTFLSNMFTDLNLTDMETGYKVFRKEVFHKIKIKENRFGFEPEIVAKIAQMRLRVYEMGISYYGRTYEEGKKIGAKDGFRALYCIFHYNAHKAPLPIQLIIYILIGTAAALFNLLAFLILYSLGLKVVISAPIAFISAAIINYFLCLAVLFRHKAKWKSSTEVIVYIAVVLAVAVLDLMITKSLLNMNIAPAAAKAVATAITFILNFMGRRFFVFPEPSSGPWQPQKER